MTMLSTIHPRGRRATLLAVLAAAAVLAGPAAARAQVVGQTDSTSQLPFAVSLRAVTIPRLPALQSYAVGTSGGRWLLLTGRRNGLHEITNQLRNVFPPNQANDSVYVVDPGAKQVWSAGLGGLPQQVADALKTTNTEWYQDGDWLYVIGGYGRDSRTDSMITFPTVTVVNVPGMIQAVTTGGALGPHVQQVNSFPLKVTGGGLLKVNGQFYLVMGQRFDGLYSANPRFADKFIQQYREQVQLLTLTPQPLGVTLGQRIQSDPNDFSRPFHRRDLNVVPEFTATGQKRVAVYGGVFQPGRSSAYRSAVYVEGTTARVDSAFQQAMSQYHAASVGLYSAATQKMHTVLFGGISLYYYDVQLGQLHEDTGLPFIRNVSVITTGAGATTQAAYGWEMPSRIGAEARVIRDPAVTTDAETGIVNLDQLPAGTATRVGWMYGGILSDVGNTDNQATQTRATNALFEVMVTRGPTPAIPLPTTRTATQLPAPAPTSGSTAQP